MLRRRAEAVYVVRDCDRCDALELAEELLVGGAVREKITDVDIMQRGHQTGEAGPPTGHDGHSIRAVTAKLAWRPPLRCSRSDDRVRRFCSSSATADVASRAITKHAMISTCAVTALTSILSEGRKCSSV